MQSSRLSLLVLLLAIVIAATFGFYRFEISPHHDAHELHPGFGVPPSALATPPAGAEPRAWWSDTLELAEHDGAVYVFLAILLVAALVNVAATESRRRLRPAVLCFLAYVVTLPIAGELLATVHLVAFGYARFVALLLHGIAVVNLAALVVLDVALPAVSVKVPRILAELIVFAGYLGLVLVLFNRLGVNVTGLVATSAVLTAVIGLSFQDTLGNIMGGLVLEMEGTLDVGDWVKIGDVVGRVRDVRWRHTAIETRNWETVFVPNGVLMKTQVIVLGKRSGAPVQLRRWVWFNVELAVPPAKVIDAVETALCAQPIARVAVEPKPNVVLMDWKDGCCVFAVRYWLTDIAVDDPTDSVIRERIYLALRRAGVRLAFPAHSISMTAEDEERRAARERTETAQRIEALSRVAIFKILDAGELQELAPRLRHAPFARGEVMTRQGAQAHWLYLIISGKASVHVTVDGLERHVATLGAGDVFGEMALLTGEARSATVIADEQVECWRLDREGFESVIKGRPEIARELSRILAVRRAELESVQAELRKDGAARQLHAVERDILSKITSFFGLAEMDESTTRAG